MTQRQKRDRRFYVALSIVMFPLLFAASFVSKLADDGTKGSLVRDAAADARSAIDIALGR
jgi:hypothetical protein